MFEWLFCKPKPEPQLHELLFPKPTEPPPPDNYCIDCKHFKMVGHNNPHCLQLDIRNRKKDIVMGPLPSVPCLEARRVGYGDIRHCKYHELKESTNG